MGDNLSGGRVDHLQRSVGVALHVATVDEQGMVAAEKGFDLRQQGNIAHEGFLIANKEKTKVNPQGLSGLDCGCRALCL